MAAINHPSFDDMRDFRQLTYTTHAQTLPTSEYLQSTQTWYSDSYQSLIHLALAGVGLATVPRQLVLDEIASGELVELDMYAYPFTDWSVSVDVLWHRGRRFPPVEEWLRLQLCRHRVHEVGRFMNRASTDSGQHPDVSSAVWVTQVLSITASII